MTIRTALFLALLTAGGVAACADDEAAVVPAARATKRFPPPDPPEAPLVLPTGPLPTAATYLPSPEVVASCEALYAAFGQWWEGCGHVPFTAAWLHERSEQCAAVAALPGIDASAEAIQQCLSSFPGASCAEIPLDCVYRPASHGHLEGWSLRRDIEDYPRYFGGAELFPPVVGSLPAGRSCDDHRQCASGFCSSQDILSSFGGDACGACLIVKHTGESCGGVAVCERDDECVGGRCQERGDGVGEPCRDAKGNSNCQRSLYCTSFTGTCQPKHQPGEPCEGSWLDTPPGTDCIDDVTVQLVTVPDGAACGQIHRCADGTVCDAGHCRKPRADLPLGASCGGADACAAPGGCVGNRCLPPPFAGTPCSAWCGEGLNCRHGYCVAPGVEGSPCGDWTQCAVGLDCERQDTKHLTTVCRPQPGLGQPCDSDHICPASQHCREGACRPFDACTAR